MIDLLLLFPARRFRKKRIQTIVNIESPLAIQGVADAELESIGMGFWTAVLGGFTEHPWESLGAEPLIESCFGLCHVLIPSE